jgi:WD40 repeat protein
MTLIYFSSFTEEFLAHSANVNSVSLGHKSGRVLVTGGGDKKVNLWAVGKPNCIMVRKKKTYNSFYR